MAIFKPISTPALSQILGVATEDVGLLCTAQTINKWAFCKPFRDTYNNYASKEACDARRRGQQGTGGGMNIPTGVNAVWEYLRPYGGIGVAPYRILDFDGYEANSAIPIVVTWQNDKLEYSNQTGKCTFGISIYARPHDNVMMSVEDMFIATELSQLYFILVITAGSNSYYIRLRGGTGGNVATVATILSSGGGAGVTFDTNVMYSMLSGQTQATASLIMGNIDSDGLNKSVSPRMYSMNCVSGHASKSFTVSYVEAHWYDGITATLSLGTPVISGQTIRVPSATFGTTGNNSTYLYYRLHFSPVGTSHPDEWEVPTSYELGVTPTSKTTTGVSTNGWTWVFPTGQTTKVINIWLVLYNSLYNATNNIDGWTAASAQVIKNG